MAKKPEPNPPQKTAPHAKRSAPKRAPKVIDLDAKQVADKKAADPKTLKPEPPLPKARGTEQTSSATKPSETQKASKPSGASAQKPGSNGSGFGALLAASLIGGVVALGGAWILGAFEAGNRPETTQPFNIAAFEQRLLQLESAGPAEEVGPDEIAAMIDARLAQQDAAQNNAALTARLEALEAQSNDSADNTEFWQVLETLQTRLAEIETRDPAPLARDEETIAALEDLTTRSDILAEQVSEAASMGEANGEQLAGVSARLEEITASLESSAQNARAAQTLAQDAATTVQTAQANMSAALQTAARNTQQRIAALTDRLENGADKLAARALAAAALKRDIDRGEPFTASLAMLQGLVENPASLQPLAPYAEKGVASQTELASQFDGVMDDILTATRPNSSNESSLTSRLLAGARNAFQVRRASDVEADGPAGAVARIEAALAEGQLTAALQEWQQLPQAGQAVSEEWHKALMARIQANAVVSQSVDAFMQQAAGQDQ